MAGAMLSPVDDPIAVFIGVIEPRPSLGSGWEWRYWIPRVHVSSGHDHGDSATRRTLVCRGDMPAFIRRQGLDRWLGRSAFYGGA